MKKLLTQLRNFKYNDKHIIGPLKVEWFHYDLNDDEFIDPRIFTDEEFKKFQEFTLANDTNFAGGKDYFDTNEDEIPNSDIYTLVPEERLDMPENLIIVPEPKLERNGVARTMYIELTDETGKKKHNYNLDFGVIGRII